MNAKPLKSPRLKTSLLRKIFTAASIRRWNDQACPVEFVELDKQAHKMVIAYLLARYEEHFHNATIDWERLILQFCYEFFERVILTDIKPPVFHKLITRHNKELVKFTLANLESDLGAYEFFENMGEYLTSSEHISNEVAREPHSGNINGGHISRGKSLESEILQAAHYYASKWEFDIIYHFNTKMYDVENIKKIIDKQVEGHYHLAGMQQIALYEDVRELITMLGQLRFQKRWSQTPRIPETSVLGHTLVVALSAYLLSLDLSACKAMRINHFLCGLFHDLPEVLTRDIISPIKHNVLGLDEYIKQIEREAVEEKILSKVPENIKDDIVYFTQNEFTNRYKIECFAHYAKSSEELFARFNDDEYEPICGEFLKACDHLSAYLEAKISIIHGISSRDLVDGAQGILEKRGNEVINELDIGAVFRDFK